MALSQPGIEQLIYKADAGDITISGKDLDTGTNIELTKIVRDSAIGASLTTGNKQFDFEINCYDFTNQAAIVTDEDNLNDLEVYVLGNTGTADLTISNVNLIVDEVANFDPASEDGGYYVIKASGTIKNS
jgi:hypothetical protein